MLSLLRLAITASSAGILVKRSAICVGSESARLSRNALYCLLSSNSLNRSSFKTANGILPGKSSAISRQTKAPRPVGRGAHRPKSQLYIKASPTTIERK